jgi:hypothetical protein
LKKNILNSIKIHKNFPVYEKKVAGKYEKVTGNNEKNRKNIVEIENN